MQDRVSMGDEPTHDENHRRTVRELHDKYGAVLGEFILRKVGVPAKAQDIKQEVFERCLLDSTVHLHTPLAYLYRIAHNLIVDGHRQEQRWQASSIDSADESLGEAPELQTNPMDRVDADIDLERLM